MNSDAIEIFKGTALLVATLVFAVGGASLWRRRIDPVAGTADAFIQTILFASAWLVVSSLIAGSGFISRINLLAMDAAFFLLALGFHILRPNAVVRNSFRTSLLASPALSAFVALAAIPAVSALAWALSSPPPPWDAFVYHLSFPAAWISEHRIFPVAVPFGDQGGTYFPINGSLIYMRIMLAARQDFATNVPQCFFLIVAALAVYRMSLSLGAPALASAASACFLFFIPIIFHQTISSEVDIIFSAFFICALHYLLAWADQPTEKGKLFFSFLALGLFIGTKSIALVFTLLIAAPLYVVVLVSRRNLKAFAWGALVVSVSGGFAYIRNWALTGNPIFPLSASAFGTDIFIGAYTRWTMMQSLFHTDSISEWIHLAATGYGWTALLFGAFCVVAAILMSRGHRRVMSIATIPPIIFMICFFIIPYNREIRFAFSAMMIAAVCAAWIGGQISGRAKLIFPWLIALVGIFNVITSCAFGGNDFHIQLARHIVGVAKRSNDIYAAMFPGALFIFVAGVGTAAIVVNSIRAGKVSRLAKPSLAVCAALAVASLIFTSAAYPSYQYKYYTGFALGRSWNALHDAAAGHLRVAFTGTDINYGLSGPMLKNKVFHASITSWDAPLFHDCLRIVKERGEYDIPRTDRIDFCRREPDFDKWLERLKHERANVLHVSVLHPNDRPHLESDKAGFPIERAWAETHPQYFRLVYMNYQVRIYLISY